MSVLTRTRVLILIAAAALVAPQLLADYPAVRVQPRMVYDPTTFTTLLFGGRAPFDRATGIGYDLAETWSWNGAKWTQKYPAHNPPARAAHMMVWDSIRNQAVLYGGESGTTTLAQLDDTWVYKNGDWTQIVTPSSPGARKLAGMAFDSTRDRVVLYGGSRLAANGRDFDQLRDTWEFDGTTWTRVAENGPNVFKPIMAYDASRNRMLMLGFDSANVVTMWEWKGVERTWEQVRPTTLPPCVNEGVMVFQQHNNTLVYAGGFCAGSPDADELFEWNGENWTKVTTATSVGRLFGHAIAYDIRRATTLTYGGTTFNGAPSNATTAFVNGNWAPQFDASSPGPRSLFGFISETDTNSVWLYGGVTDGNIHGGDLWRYQNGDWNLILQDDTPLSCVSPLTVYDTDRKRMVMYCADTNVFEFDPVAMKWAKFEFEQRNEPPARRLGSLVYDPVIKKTVLYGGFDELEYRDDTWLWDGKAWTEVKNNRMPARSLTMMWFDPSLKKVVAYGGIGRPDDEARVERYADMYQFDATNGWTKLSPSSTPGQRYGAQVVVDPATNTVVLFGGIIFEPINENTAKQFFANDQWAWNGQSWRKIELTAAPPPRENSRIVLDPFTGRLMLFGGYAGTYFSDIWTLSADHTRWTVHPEPIPSRRRPIGAVPQAPVQTSLWKFSGVQ